MLRVPLHQLDGDLPVPLYAREGDAGADLLARTDALLACQGGRAVVPTGVAVAIPAGYAGLVLPRSGLAAATASPASTHQGWSTRGTGARSRSCW